MTAHTKLTSRTRDELGDAVSLAAMFPEIAKEWDQEKNERSPEIFAPFSSHDVYWVCPKGHHYHTQIAKRTMRGDGCPYCSGKRALPGYNDLTVACPILVKEWSPNNDLSPLDVTAGSQKKVLWVCSKCGHEWSASVVNRARNGSGCPNCRYKKSMETRRRTLLKEKESFAESCPELMREWDFDKNRGFADPTQLTKGSAKSVHWLCPSCGFEWEAVINDRARGFRRCPRCSYGSQKRSYRKYSLQENM